MHKELVVKVKNMDDHFPKDDKTRIRGGFNPPPVHADNGQPEASPPATPSPPPYWQSPPREDFHHQAAAPPPAPEPFRPAQPAPDLYRLSTQQDDMWFVVDLPGGPVKYPLRHGETVTLGREASQNIVIEDKTLSRSHLIMRRNGDLVTVQVLGLNGMVYANRVHKSTTLDIAVPASLTIGNVACKIDKKYDSDATILMSDPASSSRQVSGSGLPQEGSFSAQRPASPSYSPPSLSPGRPLSESRPFAPIPPEKFPFSTSQPIPPVFSAGQQVPGAPPSSYSSQSYTPGPTIPPMGGREETPYETPPSYQQGGAAKSNGKALIIWGGMGVAVLVVAIGLFFWLRNPSPPSAPPLPLSPPLSSSPSSVAPAGLCVPGPGANNLYAKYLAKAKGYLEEGNTKDACDYLKDIPPTSACWNEAVVLSKKIDGCKLE